MHYQVIRQRAEIFEDERRDGVADNKKHKAFLDLLLSMREESKYSFDELREEVDTFMFAGNTELDAPPPTPSLKLGLYASRPVPGQRVV